MQRRQQFTSLTAQEMESLPKRLNEKAEAIKAKLELLQSSSLWCDESYVDPTTRQTLAEAIRLAESLEPLCKTWQSDIQNIVDYAKMVDKQAKAQKGQWSAAGHKYQQEQNGERIREAGAKVAQTYDRLLGLLGDIQVELFTQVDAQCDANSRQEVFLPEQMPSVADRRRIREQFLKERGAGSKSDLNRYYADMQTPPPNSVREEVLQWMGSKDFSQIIANENINNLLEEHYLRRREAGLTVLEYALKETVDDARAAIAAIGQAAPVRAAAAR